MQIIKAEVTPVELKLQNPVKMAGLPEIHNINAVFCPINNPSRTERLGMHS